MVSITSLSKISASLAAKLQHVYPLVANCVCLWLSDRLSNLYSIVWPHLETRKHLVNRIREAADSKIKHNEQKGLMSSGELRKTAENVIVLQEFVTLNDQSFDPSYENVD